MYGKENYDSRYDGRKHDRSRSSSHEKHKENRDYRSRERDRDNDRGRIQKYSSKDHHRFSDNRRGERKRKRSRTPEEWDMRSRGRADNGGSDSRRRVERRDDCGRTRDDDRGRDRDRDKERNRNRNRDRRDRRHGDDRSDKERDRRSCDGENNSSKHSRSVSVQKDKVEDRGRDEVDASKDLKKKRRRNGIPTRPKEDHVLIASRTLRFSRISTNCSEQDIIDSVKEAGMPESVNIVPLRGCAYITMPDRQSAHKILDWMAKDLLVAKKSVKIKWSTIQGLKEPEYDKLMDYWDSSRGIAQIPYNKLPEPLDQLLEGAWVDVDTLPEHLQGVYDAKGSNHNQQQQHSVLSVSLPLQNMTLPLTSYHIVPSPLPLDRKAVTPPNSRASGRMGIDDGATTPQQQMLQQLGGMGPQTCGTSTLMSPNFGTAATQHQIHVNPTSNSAVPNSQQTAAADFVQHFAAASAELLPTPFAALAPNTVLTLTETQATEAAFTHYMSLFAQKKQTIFGAEAIGTGQTQNIPNPLPDSIKQEEQEEETTLQNSPNSAYHLPDSPNRGELISEHDPVQGNMVTPVKSLKKSTKCFSVKGSGKRRIKRGGYSLGSKPSKPEPKLTCSKCQTSITNNVTCLLYHANRHHSQHPIFKCLYCDFISYNIGKSIMVDHVRKKHSDEPLAYENNSKSFSEQIRKEKENCFGPGHGCGEDLAVNVAENAAYTQQPIEQKEGSNGDQQALDSALLKEHRFSGAEITVNFKEIQNAITQVRKQQTRKSTDPDDLEAERFERMNRDARKLLEVRNQRSKNRDDEDYAEELSSEDDDEPTTSRRTRDRAAKKSTNETLQKNQKEEWLSKAKAAHLALDSTSSESEKLTKKRKANSRPNYEDDANTDEDGFDSGSEDRSYTHLPPLTRGAIKDKEHAKLFNKKLLNNSLEQLVQLMPEKDRVNITEYFKEIINNASSEEQNRQWLMDTIHKCMRTTEEMCQQAGTESEELKTMLQRISTQFIQQLL